KSQRALVKWDLKSIPPGKQVTGVTLTFNVTNRTFQSYEIYGMRREWSEASATWNHTRKGETWQIAGAQGPEDRSHTVLGSLGPAGVGVRTVTLNAYGVAQVQAWINDPGKNHGFIILNAESFDGLSLSSSETSKLGKRPRITVTYR
ncbi:MAG: DNRLRE domain-containing protein, partial [Verrucomicrobiaceae bacterium]